MCQALGGVVQTLNFIRPTGKRLKLWPKPPQWARHSLQRKSAVQGVAQSPLHPPVPPNHPTSTQHPSKRRSSIAQVLLPTTAMGGRNALNKKTSMSLLTTARMARHRPPALQALPMGPPSMAEQNESQKRRKRRRISNLSWMLLCLRPYLARRTIQLSTGQRRKSRVSRVVSVEALVRLSFSAPNLTC